MFHLSLDAFYGFDANYIPYIPWSKSKPARTSERHFLFQMTQGIHPSQTCKHTYTPIFSPSHSLHKLKNIILTLNLFQKNIR